MKKETIKKKYKKGSNEKNETIVKHKIKIEKLKIKNIIKLSL